jgi:hypothetical protein
MLPASADGQAGSQAPARLWRGSDHHGSRDAVATALARQTAIRLSP